MYQDQAYSRGGNFNRAVTGVCHFRKKNQTPKFMKILNSIPQSSQRNMNIIHRNTQKSFFRIIQLKFI